MCHAANRPFHISHSKASPIQRSIHLDIERRSIVLSARQCQLAAAQRGSSVASILLGKDFLPWASFLKCVSLFENRINDSPRVTPVKLS
jgi:hypothetical protein